MAEHQDWFSADRPITIRVDDKLGRRAFAEALAASVSGYKGRDSLVIGLYGAWGTGKSSIKNMVMDVLREKPGRDVPSIAEFNPWQFANREQLTEAFFDQIGIALGKGASASRKDQRRVLQRWRRYATALRAGAGLVDHTRKLLIVGLFVTAALVGIAATQVWRVAVTIVLILVGLAGLLRWWSKFADLVGGLFEPGLEVGRKSLEEVKAELSDALRDLPSPLLVVIDDIDRLIPSEVQELFQLIKVNADFPNVVYLVLFDRSVVEKNIEKVVAVSGRDYLRKIVQVGFDVPLIERARLHRVLANGLDRVISEPAVSKRFNKHRWGNLFLGGLQAHFKTLRDVNRFLSTLAFHTSLFRAGQSFHVNPVDLIGLRRLDTLVDEEGLARLKDLCVSSIEAAASSGRLVQIGDLASILYRWKEWVGDTRPNAFVQELARLRPAQSRSCKRFCSGRLPTPWMTTWRSSIGTSAWVQSRPSSLGRPLKPS